MQIHVLSSNRTAAGRRIQLNRPLLDAYLKAFREAAASYQPAATAGSEPALPHSRDVRARGDAELDETTAQRPLRRMTRGGARRC